MSAQPRLLVVIPAYNAERTLELALRSARQPGVDGVFVSDDGSTDGTAEVAESLGARVLRGENQGPASARNRALDALEPGPHVLFLDADDELAPDAAAVIRHRLSREPGAACLVGAHESVQPGEGSEAPARLREPEADWVQAGRLPHPGLALGTEHVFCTSGLTLTSRALDPDSVAGPPLRFDESLIFAEDRELIFRAGARGSILITDHVLLRKYEEPGRLTGDPARVARWLADQFTLIERHGGPGADSETLDALQRSTTWLVKHRCRRLAERGEALSPEEWRRIRRIFSAHRWPVPGRVRRHVLGSSIRRAFGLKPAHAAGEFCDAEA